MNDENQISDISSTHVFAKHFGQVIPFPKDLYIPPEALQIFLETFEGPLDLLWYLIKKQNIDILDIPMAKITQQYVDYIEMMQTLQLEIAADYLVMASLLAEIKSRMLLPQPEEISEEEDPRALLVEKLKRYEAFRIASIQLDEMPRLDRDFYKTEVAFEVKQKTEVPPSLGLSDLLFAFHDVLKLQKMKTHHQVRREALSIRERMSQVLLRLQTQSFYDFSDLFPKDEGRMGVVVTFMAILELWKQSLIELVQAQPFSQIYIKGKSNGT